MINSIIVDDELHSHEILKWKLKEIDADVDVIKCFERSELALEYLRTHSIDLVFLDIQMPHLSGLELLESLDNINFSVIFTTAFDQYAIEAIKLSALDYLLKPIDIEQLKLAIDKVITQLNYKNHHSQIQNLISNQTKKIKSKNIPLATKESIEFVEIGNIVSCSSQSNYTKVNFIEGHSKLISKTLKEFEEQLCDFGFYRVHNSHLINIEHVKKFMRKDGGYLLMTNEMKIPISKNKKDDLFKLLVV